MKVEILRALHGTAEFQMLLEELKKAKPIVPQYDPIKKNIDEMIAQSCKQQGYESVMRIINPF